MEGVATLCGGVGWAGSTKVEEAERMRAAAVGRFGDSVNFLSKMLRSMYLIDRPADDDSIMSLIFDRATQSWVICQATQNGKIVWRRSQDKPEVCRKKKGPMIPPSYFPLHSTVLMAYLISSLSVFSVN